MKLFKNLALALAFTFLLSCDADDLITGLNSVMTAKVNGSSFDAIGVSATRTPAVGPIPEGFVVGGNEGSSYPAMTLTLYTISTGTYVLGAATSNAPFAVYAESAGSQGISISGTITINRIDYALNGKVEGTFSFETGNFSVTEGTFDATFVN